jgi:hypothetical protein
VSRCDYLMVIERLTSALAWRAGANRKLNRVQRSSNFANIPRDEDRSSPSMPFERHWDLYFNFTNNIVVMYAAAATPKDGWRWSYHIIILIRMVAGVGSASVFLIATGSSCAGQRAQC